MINEAEMAESLVKGWRRFQRGKYRQTLNDYLQFLIRAGFYESPFHQILPNPAYDAAVRDLGREFLQYAAYNAMCLGTVFPGNFVESREETQAKWQIRVFRLPVYLGGDYEWTLEISFAHCHDKLDFPKRPQLRQIYE